MGQPQNKAPIMTKEELFEKQKQMLLTFAKTVSISKEYCEQEIRILAEKMGVADCGSVK